MTDTTETLEIVRQANPITNPAATAEQQGVYEPLLAEIDRKSTAPTRRPRMPKASRKAAWAFAASFLVVLAVVGIVALLRATDAPGPPVDEQPATTSDLAETTIPPSTSEAVATTDAPPESAASEPLGYDTVLDGSAAAYGTSLALTRDGNPVVASYMSDGDPRDVPPGDDGPTVNVFRLLRCSDPHCVAAPQIVDLVEGDGSSDSIPYSRDFSLDPADRPIVAFSLFNHGLTLLFCNDPGCESFEVREVADLYAGSVLSGFRNGWAYTVDGNPLYTRFEDPWREQNEDLTGTMAGSTLELVACLDRFCDAFEATAIDSGTWLGASAPVIARDGSVLVAYSVHEPTGPPDPEAGYDGAVRYGYQRVAYCPDVVCAGGPLITTIDEGPHVGGGTMVVEAGVPTIWYYSGYDPVRLPTGPEDEHLAVTQRTVGKATCLDPSCARFDLVTIGPLETSGSASSLLPSGIPVGSWGGRDHWAVAADGTQLGLMRPGVTLLRWSESAPDVWQFTAVAEFQGEAEAPFFMDAAIALDPGGLPLIAYGDSEGVHLIRCPDVACARP